MVQRFSRRALAVSLLAFILGVGAVGPAAAAQRNMTQANSTQANLAKANTHDRNAVARSAADKPGAPGDIQIDPTSITGPGTSITVEVSPELSLIDASVEVVAQGAITVDEVAQEVPTGQDSTVDVSAGAPSGPAVVTATLTGTDATGTDLSISDTLWVDSVDGTAVVSAIGIQDLTLQTIDVRESTGLISAAEADAARTEALGGTTFATALALAVCVDLCAAGTVQWTDSIGGLHPVRQAPVEIRDADNDSLVTTVTTDDTGAYSAAFDNNGVDPNGRDIYIRVLAAGPGFDVGGKYIESGITADIVTGTELTTDFVANNVDDNNTAFSLQNAMVVAGEYVLGVRGTAFPAIHIVFPSAGGSFYDGTDLQVDGGDRWDWDVMLHEYGHYIMDLMNIEANPGGTHSSGDNLSDSRGSKEIGIPLAWGEGWPTYFAVSSLREMGTAALGIPNIGDTSYQDTEDQIVTDDLEIGGTLGEDNEFTVMSILWDLYDSENDGLDTVSLGTGVIWNLLDDNDPTTLSQAYQLFAPDTSAGANAVNCVFSDHNVASLITGPALNDVGPTAVSPVLVWSAGNGGTHPNNQFVVEYRDGNTGALLYESGSLAVTTFTATVADWAVIKAASTGLIDISIVASQVDEPITGPYRSCWQQFDVGPIVIAAPDALTVDPGASTISVLANDTVNKVAAVVGVDVVLTPVTAVDGLSIDAAGVITVSASAVIGTYAFPYRICAVSDPVVCVDGVATVVVGVPVIAVDDAFGEVVRGGSTATVLANDTKGAAAADLSNVVLTPGTSPQAGLSMSAYGVITVSGAVPAGSYSFEYTICSVVVPTLCDSAVATLTVPSAAQQAGPGGGPGRPSVTAPHLASTGVDAGQAGWLALTLLMAGAALMVIGRRRAHPLLPGQGSTT